MRSDIRDENFKKMDCEKPDAYSWLFHEIMDDMNACIFVTRAESGEILYMNRKMKEIYGLTEPEGSICWQVLQENMEDKCPFCKVGCLLDCHKDHRQIIWQEDNQRTGRVFEHTESLITWIDGSLVHMQQSVDITEKIILNQQATTDELCGILNRKAGKKKLEQTIMEIRKSGRQAVVSMIDINDLKIINDRKGHLAGDQALVFVTDRLKKMIGEEDYLFRLGGDEFVAVFLNKNEKKVDAILAKCNRECQNYQNEKMLSEIPTFCYGSYVVTEACQLNESEVIASADKNMYQNKLRYHSDRMVEEHENLPLLKAGERFSFDSKFLYDALIRSTDDFIYVCNMKTGKFCYSPLLVRTFGFPSEVMSQPMPYWKKIVHPEDWHRFYQSNREIGDGKTNYHCVEFRAMQVNGEYQWLRCRGYLVRDEYDKPDLFAGFLYKLDKQNKIDGITSLLSIHEFSRRFDEFISNHYNEPIAMMILALDNFKNLNNLYNWDFGNRILKKCGQVIFQIIPENASVYKLDGDRFGILIERPKEYQAAELYEEIQKHFMKMDVLEQTPIRITCSGGCCTYPQDANSYLDMVKYCDYALQYSKDHGKNTLTFFHQSIRNSKSRSLELLHALQDSVIHNFHGFFLMYQPQVDAASGRIKGAEALLRFYCDKLSNVSPMEFIPILEDNQLINSVGKWVLESALAALKEILLYDNEFTVSVNVSYLQLLDVDYIKDLMEIVRENQINPGNIIIELTESYRVQSMQKLREIFEELRTFGIRVAMDDFGSGYSSLQLLKNAPYDIVKVDKSFIDGILKSKFEVAFINCIVRLCHEVGILVCLEGVELEEEYKLLKDISPDYIQGYYFGKPQKKEDIINKYLDVQTDRE